MDKNKLKRRTFVKTMAATGIGAALPVAGFSILPSKNKKTVKIGVVGTGNRGTGLLRELLAIDGVEIPAVCDIDQGRLDNAVKVCEDAGRKKPEAYTGDEYAFQKLMEREDLDAVIIATYWEWHAPMAVYAMKQGKYPGVEVPAALSLQECWDLVNTSEETGIPCMMLENWSFRKDNLAVLNMIRQGLLGNIVHCHSAHSHDCIDHWFFDAEDGHQRWGAKYLLQYNRDQYPTHGLGPVLSWMDINCGDRITQIFSSATASTSINAYFKRRFGEDHPNANLEYKQGDIVTSTLKTQNGKTIIVNYDMQLPRPYDNRWMIQGTLGIYNEQREAVHLVDRSPEYHQWEPFRPYEDEFMHKWWQKRGKKQGGHGGVDSLELELFVKAVRDQTNTPLDVYDSVTMSAVVPLSGHAIEQNQPVEFPDFTRGKWQNRKPYFAV
jgi:predicted dehydrogenase